MVHYVYILSCCDGEFYTGMTENLKRRLVEHVNGENIATKYRRPVKLVYFSGFVNKKLAINFEKYLKSHAGRAFRNKHLAEPARRSEVKPR